MINKARDNAEIAKIQTFTAHNHQAVGAFATAIFDFEEGNGNLVKDLSGGQRDSTIIGAEWSNDTGNNSDSSLIFGAGDYIQIANTDTLNFQKYTLSAWIKATPSSGWRGIISKDGTYPTNRNYWFGLSAGGSGYPTEGKLLILGKSQNWDDIRASSPAALDDGLWHHVVATSGDGKTFLFVDGEKVGEDTYPAGITPTSRFIFVGKNIPANDYSFYGNIDDVRIYSDSLSFSQIERIYTEGLQKYLANNN